MRLKARGQTNSALSEHGPLPVPHEPAVIIQPGAPDVRSLRVVRPLHHRELLGCHAVQEFGRPVLIRPLPVRPGGGEVARGVAHDQRAPLVRRRPGEGAVRCGLLRVPQRLSVRCGSGARQVFRRRRTLKTTTSPAFISSCRTCSLCVSPSRISSGSGRFASVHNGYCWHSWKNATQMLAISWQLTVGAVHDAEAARAGGDVGELPHDGDEAIVKLAVPEDVVFVGIEVRPGGAVQGLALGPVLHRDEAHAVVLRAARGA